jgi:hypothetical protein
MSHLAGVIPLAAKPLDFNFPWHDSLMPIGRDYLAVERSVVECAYMGCDTIWVVCNDDIQPLVRHRLGDYIQDPVNLYRKHFLGSKQLRKEIPIFYVPLHPKDKWNCLAWSILHGANTAYFVGKKISKWTIPDTFYVSFPYGVYPPESVRPYRQKENVMLSFEGKTVKDGEYLGFMFKEDDYKNFRDNVKSLKVDKNLPLQERWSDEFFTLDKIFKSFIVECMVVDLPWYKKVDSWEGLRGYLSGEESIERPSKDILCYHEFNPVGEENAE